MIRSFSVWAACIVFTVGGGSGDAGRAGATATNQEVVQVTDKATSSHDATFSDDPIRQLADKTVLPEYPRAAMDKNLQGVVVAELQLDEGRRIQTIDILEAPGPEIASSVKAALAKWHFRPSSEDPSGLSLKGRSFKGKVTFYFYRKDGRFQVASPKEAPSIKK